MEENGYSTENPSRFSKLLSWMAYPASAIAGLWTAHVNIGDAVYDRLKTDHALDDLRSNLLQERRGLSEAAAKECTTGKPGDHCRSYAERCIETDRRYFPKIEQRLRELELDTFGKQWKFVHRSHRQNAVMNGMFMSSVVLGAMLGIADSKTIAHLLGEKSAPTKNEPPAR
jgi:hypothetical protein